MAEETEVLGAMHSIIDAPFHERRYIAVVSDDEYAIRRSGGSADHGASQWASAWKTMQGSLLRAGEAVQRKLHSAPVTSSPETETTLEPTSSVPEVRKEVKVDHGAGSIALVTLRQCTDLTFLSGSAEVGQVYAANPLENDVYYQVATYNDDLTDHKISELERILNSLGAKSYKISYEDSEASSRGIGSALKIFAGGSFNGELTRTRKRRFERSGTSDGHDPKLPDNLVWYHREPTWQALAESRLHHGRKDFALSVELEQSFRLSAKAIADIKAISADAMVHQDRNTALTLSVSGTF